MSLIRNDSQWADATRVGGLLQRSVFRVWASHGLFSDEYLAHNGIVKRLCDHQIVFRDSLILIAELDFEFDESTNLAKEWREFRKKQIPKASKLLLQAEQRLLSGQPVYLDEECKQALDVRGLGIQKVFKLCVTNAFEVIDGIRHPMLHGYGSVFYAEEFVLDMDTLPLHLFSFSGFAQLLRELTTVEDFLNFLQFQRLAIQQERLDYDTESDLLELFFRSGVVFDQARAIEAQLVHSKLMSQPSPLLQTLPDAEGEGLFRRLRQEARLWEELMDAYCNQLMAGMVEWLPEQTPIAPHDIVTMLADETVFSRAQLARAVNDFLQQPAAVQQEGTLLHERSYTHPLRHHAIVFFAAGQESPMSLEQAPVLLPHIGNQVNQAVQNPPLDEILVWGLGLNRGQICSIQLFFRHGRNVHKIPLGQPLRNQSM